MNNFLRSIYLMLMLLVAVSIKVSAQTEVSNVTELQSAVSSASDGAVITLSTSFVFGSVTIPMPTVNVTIDGGDQVWTTGGITVNGAGSGALTIQKLKMDGTGVSGRLLNNTASNGKLVLEKMEFYEAKGGAVNISSSGNATSEINNTKIYNNNAGAGPAIWAGDKANLTINGSTIEENSGSSAGYECGAIASKGFNGTLTINNTIFRNNINKAANTGVVGGGGGAISMHFLYGKLIINECYFQGNKTFGEEGNVKSTYDGGAIYILDGQGNDAELKIDKTTFDSNLAYDDGGAMMIQGKGGTAFKTTITNCTFYGNRAYGLTGASKSGGAIQFFRGGMSNTMTNNLASCTFVGNISGNADTKVNQQGGAIGLSGGTVAAPLTRNDCLFIGNIVYGSNGQENSSSNNKDVSNSTVTQAGTANVINVDKGATPAYSLKDVLGTDIPTLVPNQSGITAGTDDDKIIIPTIPIRPEGIADNTYNGNVTPPADDQRGFQRYKDQGAVEISWVKYHSTSGQFGLAPLTAYDGTEYYLPDTVYYTVSAIGENTTVVDGGTAKLKGTHPDGKVFKGWATDSTATEPDAAYAVGAPLVYADENLTLYAIWGELTAFNVIYESGTGTGGPVVIPSVPAGNYTVLNNTDPQLNFVAPANHVFTNWKDKVSTSYAAGNIINIVSDTTLIAQWKADTPPITPVYKVTYHPNGGGGIEHRIDCEDDGSHTILNYADDPLNYTSPEGDYVFENWNTMPDGSGTFYVIGLTTTFTKDMDLYAQWKKKDPIDPIDPDAEEGIKIKPMAPFCPTDAFIHIPYDILYTDYPMEYTVVFSEEAKAAGFKDMDVFTALPENYIAIPIPVDVAKGTYVGKIVLRNTDQAEIITDYAFEFDVLSGVAIIEEPESVRGCQGDAYRLAVQASGDALTYQWYYNGEEIRGATSNEYSHTISAETTGLYYVIVSGTCGSLKSDSVQVTMNTLSILIKWDDVLYVDNTDNRYVKFQWYKDGQAISETGIFIYYTDVEGLNGSYSVRAYYADGTYDESCALVFTADSPRASLKVYPNPVRNNSYLTIEGNTPSTAKSNYLIELFDLSGRKLYYNYSDSELTTIPINAASGVYLLHVTAPNGKKTVTKVVVK